MIVESSSGPNIYNDKFDPNGLVYLSEEAANKVQNVALLSGDILCDITGDSVARVNLVPDKYLPARVNQHVAIISPNQTDLMLGIYAMCSCPFTINRIYSLLLVQAQLIMH